jgi:hypothetical protein
MTMIGAMLDCGRQFRAGGATAGCLPPAARPAGRNR